MKEATEYVKMHVHLDHPDTTPVIPKHHATCLEKIPRQVWELESSEAKYNWWLSRWSEYKQLYGLKDLQLTTELQAWLSTDLSMQLQRSMGSGLTSSTEVSILKTIKSFAVQSGSILLHRYTLSNMQRDMLHLSNWLSVQAELLRPDDNGHHHQGYP